MSPSAPNTFICWLSSRPIDSWASGRPILDPAKHYSGIAKKQAARRLSALGLRPEGHTWGKNAHVVPVESEEHYLYLRDKYIPEHVHEGAVVHSIHIAPTIDRSNQST